MPFTRTALRCLVIAVASTGLACADAPTGVPTPDEDDAASSRHDAGTLPFSEEMAHLGDLIFDDQNLSIGRNQSCASCHSSEWGFTGPSSEVNVAGAVYEGSIPGRFGDRKPPSSAYSTLSPQFGFSRQGGGMFA